VITLDAAEARAVVVLIGALIRDWAVARRPVPYSVLRLHQRLNAAVSLSSSGQSKALRLRELNVSPITTRQAAEILKWVPRRVRRNAADLGGRLVGDRWTFDEHEVREYAKALQNKENTA
jgi:hypothetical protein